MEVYLLSCSRFEISSSYRRIFNPDKAAKGLPESGYGYYLYIYSSTQEIDWWVDLLFPGRLAGINSSFPNGDIGPALGDNLSFLPRVAPEAIEEFKPFRLLISKSHLFEFLIPKRKLICISPKAYLDDILKNIFSLFSDISPKAYF